MDEDAIEVFKRPQCQPFIRKLESRGYVYEILDIVTCMMRFSSGRNTPVDSRESRPENVDMHLDIQKENMSALLHALQALL
jgi:glutaredoxin-related protein